MLGIQTTTQRRPGWQLQLLVVPQQLCSKRECCTLSHGYLPASTTLPLLVLNPPERPPGFLEASTNVTAYPCSDKCFAAPKPAQPPPTTTTRLRLSGLLASLVLKLVFRVVLLLVAWKSTFPMLLPVLLAAAARRTDLGCCLADLKQWLLSTSMFEGCNRLCCCLAPQQPLHADVGKIHVVT